MLRLSEMVFIRVTPLDHSPKLPDARLHRFDALFSPSLSLAYHSLSNYEKFKDFLVRLVTNPITVDQIQFDESQSTASLNRCTRIGCFRNGMYRIERVLHFPQPLANDVFQNDRTH